jgi:FKBP-type peptidyl-prolyl cis-trans isomerase FkpA
MQKSKFAFFGIVSCATMAAFSACNNHSKTTEVKTVVDTTPKMTAPSLSTSHSSVANDSLFVKDGSGLDCKFVTHGTGTTAPAVGDVVEVSVIFRVGDSTMANTDMQNGHKPVQQQIAAPSMKGDLMSGLMKMKAGDSAVFRILADTFFARAHQPMLGWVKPGDYLVWEVKMVNVMSKAQMEAEMAKKNKVQNDIDDKKIQAYFKAHNVKNAKKTASGMYYVVTKPGSGAHPKDGQKATVNYTGQNLKGEKFDSNVDPAFHHVQPFDFTIGSGVIVGWSQAVPLMNKGEKATFYIPSSLAYGPQAKDAKIGANEVLIFDIELTDFK